jgi:hypothetical protein
MLAKLYKNAPTQSNTDEKQRKALLLIGVAKKIAGKWQRQ